MEKKNLLMLLLTYQISSFLTINKLKNGLMNKYFVKNYQQIKCIKKLFMLKYCNKMEEAYVVFIVYGMEFAF